MTYKKIRYRITTTLCTLLLLSPVAAQAATDEDLAAMREQLMALSERLDRLEAENRELTATNAELVKNSQETAVTVAAVSEKTDAVATDVEAAGSKNQVDRNHSLERRFPLPL